MSEKPLTETLFAVHALVGAGRDRPTVGKVLPSLKKEVRFWMLTVFSKRKKIPKTMAVWMPALDVKQRTMQIFSDHPTYSPHRMNKTSNQSHERWRQTLARSASWWTGRSLCRGNGAGGRRINQDPCAEPASQVDRWHTDRAAGV